MSDYLNPYKPIMLLNLNGGGVRGYASLCSLEEVEKAIKKELDTIGRGDLYSEDFKPCDYFDIMCGTSTGGIIAIMLGRLRMSIKACMDAYIKFAKEVFGTSKFEATFRGVKTFFSRKDNDLCFYRYCPKRLERAIVRCLEEQGLTAEEPLVPAGGFSGGCKVLVPVIELTDTKFVPRMLRTYDESDIEPENGTGWTIKAALMAATAAPTVFPTYQYEERGYVDAASHGMNNPAVESYGELQRLYLHRKEALFLDVGTGTHERLLLPSGSDFRKNASTVFKQMLSQPTDTRLPSQMVELSCNGLNGSETTYYRVDVKFPSECESIKSHHYNKIPVLGDQVAEYNKNLEARDKIEQVSRRIVDVLTGDYHRKETPWVRQARLYEPCNRVGVPGSSNGICLFNRRNRNLFACSSPSEWVPYTSTRMPEEFRKLQSASKIIQLAINGQPQPKELEKATSDLHQVLKAQWDALDASPESRNTLEHEQILTVFKLWIAHDLIGNEDISIGTEARLHKLLLASEGAKPLYGDDVLNPCQWFSKYPLAPTEKTEDA